MDRGTWQVTVHGVAKSQTRLNTHPWVFSVSLAHTNASWLNFPSSVHCYLIKVWSYHFLSSSLLSKDLTFETTSSASNCSKLFSLFHLPNIFSGQNEMSCYLMQIPLVFHCSLPLPKPRMPYFCMFKSYSTLRPSTTCWVQSLSCSILSWSLWWPLTLSTS